MPLVSGKDGTVRLAGQEALRVSDWRVRKTAANKAYSANDTGGGHKRVPGVCDCSGRLVVQASSSDRVPVAEGDIVDLVLHADASGENYYVLSAIIDSIRLRVDIGQGSPLAYVILFSSHGRIAGHGMLSTTGIGGG